MYAAIHSPGTADPSSLMACGADFSPVVEETAADTVAFDVSGLERLFRTPGELAEAIMRRAAELGLKPRVALAPNPDAAVCAARGFEGVTLMPPATLAPLSLAVLHPSPQVLETLARWGIHTCAQLAALPEAGIAERLGPEGVHLRRLARGTASRPLRPAYPPPVYESAVELEYPLALLEPLAFLLSRLLGDVCAKLESHGMATHELRVRLKLETGAAHERTLRLPHPMRDAAIFLKLLKLDLDAHPPSAPIIEVALAAEPVNPRVVQHGLFVPIEPEPQKLELTLARIAKIVGEGNVGSPELLDTHRPGAFRMQRFKCGADAHVRGPAPRPAVFSEPDVGVRRGPEGPPHLADAKRMALRVFRPPLKARVQAPAGRPARIAARGLQGKVLSSAGPWRTSGEWWSADPWSHDEWDVALDDGALYRIYLDRIHGAWFIRGAYD